MARRRGRKRLPLDPVASLPATRLALHGPEETDRAPSLGTRARGLGALPGIPVYACGDTYEEARESYREALAAHEAYEREVDKRVTSGNI